MREQHDTIVIGGGQAGLAMSAVLQRLERLQGDGLRVVHTLTRSQPPDWTGYARRVDAEMLAEVGPSPAELPRVYVCGPTPFVEAVAEALAQLGHESRDVKTERFGPTGG
jgi:ferredoxin-NADP reductase